MIVIDAVPQSVHSLDEVHEPTLICVLNSTGVR